MRYWNIRSVISSGTRTFAVAIPCSIAAFIGDRAFNERPDRHPTSNIAQGTQDPNLNVEWFIDKIEITALSDNSAKDEIYLMVSTDEKGKVMRRQFPGGTDRHVAGKYWPTPKHGTTPSQKIYYGSLVPGETIRTYVAILDDDNTGSTARALNEAGDAAMKSGNPFVAAGGTLAKGVASLMGGSKDDLMGELTITSKNEGDKLLACVAGTGHEGADWTAREIVATGANKGALQGAFYRKGNSSGWGYTVTLSPRVRGLRVPYTMLPGCVL